MRLATIVGLLSLLVAASAQGRPLLYISCGEGGDEVCRPLATALRGLGRYEVWTMDDRMTLASMTNQEAGLVEACAKAAEPGCQDLMRQLSMDLLLQVEVKGRAVEYRMVLLPEGEVLGEGRREGDAKAVARAVAKDGHRAVLASQGARGRFSREEEPVLPERRLRWTWVAGGLTVVAAVAATLVSVEAQSQESKLHDAFALALEEPQAATLLMDNADKAESHAMAANVLWGVTGGLMVATVVILCLEVFSGPDDPEVPRRLTFAPEVGLGSLALSISTRF